MLKGEFVSITESVLPKANLELVFTSETIEPAREATSLQALLYLIEPQDDLFCGFDPNMVFNSDSKPKDEHHYNYLLNTSFVSVAICDLLVAKVMSLVNFVSDEVPIVDPNCVEPSLTLLDSSFDASVVHASSKSTIVPEPLNIVVAEPSIASRLKKECQFILLD